MAGSAWHSPSNGVRVEFRGEEFLDIRHFLWALVIVSGLTFPYRT
jgi:hypothetical protein